MLGAQEEDGSGDLLRRGDAAERDGGKDTLAVFRIAQRGGRHVGGDPPGRDTVHVDPVARKLRGKALHHANDGALGGSVVSVESFSALAGGGADNDDVAAAPL